ncbi:hypothetical protein [Spongiibacter tropicus]|uniref:hypothetical protein n=1 Tax=Spongiibacter tropicus TaxID=454602 RepID=UPI0024E265B2|nr:hypothetical protein [Spongiibacter tropicus]
MRVILGLSFLLISMSSWACQPLTQGERYWPNPTKGESRVFFDSIEVKLVKVSRGGPDAPCNDAGMVLFEVSYTEKGIEDLDLITKMALSDVGIYFMPTSKDEYGILPNIPMKAVQGKDGKYYISFAWVDHQPGKQKDISLGYDIKFISNQLNLSGVKSSGTIEANSVNK